MNLMSAARHLEDARLMTIHRQPFASELLARRIPVVCFEPAEIAAPCFPGRGHLIRRDIEDLEQAALVGGVETLRRFRPKLQGSAYHKVGNIVDLPLWLHGLHLGHRFHLGHHDTFIIETDLYAVAE